MFKKFITIVIAAGAAAAYYLLKNDTGNSTTQVPSASKPLPKEEKKAEKTEAVVSYEEKEPVEEVKEEAVKEEAPTEAEVTEEVKEESVQEEAVKEEASEFDALVNDLDAALAELKEKNEPVGPFTEEKEEVKEEEPVKTEVLPEEPEVIEVPEAEDIFEEIASRVENKEEPLEEVVTEEEPILEEKRALSREEEIRRLLNDEDDEVEDTYVEEPLQRSAKNKPEEQNKSGNSRKLLELQVDLVMANYPDDYVFLLQHHILPNRNLEKLEADIKGREYAIVYSDEGITAQKVIIQRNREIKDEILTMAEVAKKYGAVYRGFNVIPQ